MKFIKKYFWKITSLVLALVLLLECNANKTNANYVVIPEKKGSFEIKNPTEVKDSISYKYITLKGDTIELENPINIELARRYQLETDSLKKELLYYQAIQQRKYKQTFEDKNLKADVYALTTGTLDSIKFDYTIKSDTIKVKQPVFSLLGGLSLQSNINTFKTYPGLNIGFQNKKKNILLLGINTNQDIEIKYIKNIFTIKK